MPAGSWLDGRGLPAKSETDCPSLIKSCVECKPKHFHQLIRSLIAKRRQHCTWPGHTSCCCSTEIGVNCSCGLSYRMIALQERAITHTHTHMHTCVHICLQIRTYIHTCTHVCTHGYSVMSSLIYEGDNMVLNMWLHTGTHSYK